MKVSDEIRNWCEFEDGTECGGFVTKASFDKLCDLADRIDAEMVELPKDADGEPIRVGDVMDKGEVTCIRDCGEGWEVVLNNLYTYDTPSLHHHKPTVEDVLREFADEMNQNLGMYTGEVIDADEWRDADAKTVEKFAAKLRLAGEDE